MSYTIRITFLSKLTKTQLYSRNDKKIGAFLSFFVTQLSQYGTFDARTLPTTISERSWIMIGFKIASSRTLHEIPAYDWRKDWNMDTFFKALEVVYAVEHADRFMETGSIWQAIALDLCRDLNKPNHKRKDCTPGHEPKHPDFNKEGKWVGCATYKTVGLPRSRRRTPDSAIQLSRRWNTHGA